jgi:hypothetical protein
MMTPPSLFRPLLLLCLERGDVNEGNTHTGGQVQFPTPVVCGWSPPRRGDDISARPRSKLAVGPRGLALKLNAPADGGGGLAADLH